MTDEELRDLQERVSMIRAMVENPGWALLQDYAAAVLMPKQMRIVQGKCPSQEEYKSDCAYIDGMRYVFALPDVLQTRIDNELAIREEDKEEEEEDELVYADEGG